MAEVARAKISNLLITAKTPEPNLSSAEIASLNEVSTRVNTVILPADKGGGLVVLDKQDYRSKVLELLADKQTYSRVDCDPAPMVFDQLVARLRPLKEEKKIDQKTYRAIYPTTKLLPRLYGLPKTHKSGIPLRPIVSSVGTITCPVAKFVARIISPLVGQSPAHVKNSAEFKGFISSVILDPQETLISYDVTALFTSVPINKVLDIVRLRLNSDPDFSSRTTLEVPDVCNLLEFCLTTTYFVFEGNFYKQCFGAAMGSPVSAVVANIFMEDFEQRALSSFPHPVVFWRRYVDDILAAIKRSLLRTFLIHLNSLEPSIKFTTECESEGKISFLDLLCQRNADGSIMTSVFRKPMALGQYLHFRSDHPLGVKIGIVKTLIRRAIALCSTQESMDAEIKTVETELQNNGYPLQLIRRISKELQTPAQRRDRDDCVARVCVPYVRGVSEAIRRVLSKTGVQVAFKPQKTIRQFLVKPKDRLSVTDVNEVVYKLSCNDCPCVYVGETGRQLRTRVAEHESALRNNHPDRSAVAEHAILTGHNIGFTDAQVLDRATHYKERRLKESIHASLHEDILNRDDLAFIPTAWKPLVAFMKSKRS